MSTEPHAPRIDKTTGYWFTRWQTGELNAQGKPKKAGKTFGHSSKVSRSIAMRRFSNWLIQRGQDAAIPTSGNILAVLINAYLEHAKVYYRRPDGTLTGEHVNIDYALRPLRSLFGEMDAAALRPRHVKDYLAAQIDAGTARTTINKRLGIIKRMYDWAVREEVVPAEVLGAINVVHSIERGRTEAAEPAPVKPVSVRHMAETMRRLDPIVSAMVRLQWLTGMRPGEVCGLNPQQIDRTRTTWLYVPTRHKMAHKSRVRIVAFGPKARQLLQPYLFRAADGACFSPQESRRWWNEQRRKAAKAPRAKVKETYAHVGTQFTSKTYADAIERAAGKAGVPSWSPNQIRHSAATRADRKDGKRAAQRLLGHASGKTTAIYIDEDVQKLMENAERAG